MTWEWRWGGYKERNTDDEIVKSGDMENLGLIMVTGEKELVLERFLW